MKNGGGLGSKVWEIIRISFTLIRKGICMKKIMLELSLMMKRGKISGKALRNLKHHHHGPGSREEYEFSCSNTPLYRHYFTTTATKKKRSNSICFTYEPTGEVETNYMDAVDRVLDRIIRLQNNKDYVKEFDEEDNRGHDCVDEAAEEFITKFYSQLKLQPATPLLN